jgi:hypothetical protein
VSQVAWVGGCYLLYLLACALQYRYLDYLLTWLIHKSSEAADSWRGASAQMHSTSMFLYRCAELVELI